MALSVDNLTHHATGSFTGTSGSAALTGGEVTEAGNTVILVVYSIGSGTLTVPTGFVQDHATSGSTTHKIAAFRRSNVPAGESSWTVAVSASQLTFWVVREYSGIDVNTPLLGVTTHTNAGLAAGGERAISTIYTANPSEDSIALGFAGAFLAGATPADLGVSATELAETSPGTVAGEVDTVSGTGGGNAVTLSVFEEFSGARTGLSYTATIRYTTDLAATLTSFGVAYRATISAIYPVLTHILGAQHGTTAGWTTGTAGFRYLESASAGVSITTTNPRHDTYAFRCNATTTACNFTSTAVTLSGGVFVGRFSFRLNATPGANLELGGTTTGVTFRYVQATGKVGCQLPGGTEQVSAAAVSSGNWYSIDYRLDTSGTAWQCEWSTTVDSTSTLTTETTATATGVATTSFTPRLGWTTATTGDVNFADLVCSSTVAAYPMGDYQVKVAKIDGAQSAGAFDSAVATDFGTFTANGTVAAWNAATATTRIDELPATIGASADGVAQLAVGSTALGNIVQVRFNFESVTYAPTFAAKGLRCCVVGWAAAATAANIAFNMFTTTGSSAFAPVADYGLDNSTTAPAWVCSGVLFSGASGTRLTNAIMSNASGKYLTMGDSTDAAPDIGLHAAYLEIACKATVSAGLFGDQATQVRDTDTGGLMQASVAAPVGGPASLYYETSGTPTTVPVPQDTAITELVDAASGTATNYIALYFPPEGVPDA